MMKYLGVLECMLESVTGSQGQEIWIFQLRTVCRERPQRAYRPREALGVLKALFLDEHVVGPICCSSTTITSWIKCMHGVVHHTRMTFQMLLIVRNRVFREVSRFSSIAPPPSITPRSVLGTRTINVTTVQ